MYRGFSVSINKAAESLGAAKNFSMHGGANAGVHNSESRETASSEETMISDFQDVSRYLILNSLTLDDSSCCCMARRAGNSTFCGCSSISIIESSKIWNLMKPRFFTANKMPS